MTSTTTSTLTITEPPAGLYDSLPYIDANFAQDTQLKASVAALVSQEIQSSKRRFKDFVHFVDNLYPSPPHSADSAMFRQDIERYEKTKQLPEKANHHQKYADFEYEIPSAADLTPTQWLDVIDTLKTSINYHQKHVMHLELHREFGKEQWVDALQDTATQIQRYDTQIKVLEDNIEYVNKVRKYRQEQVQDELGSMKEESNNQIDENLRLQQELYQQTVHKRQKTSQQ